jgi:hypothetical protein
VTASSEKPNPLYPLTNAAANTQAVQKTRAGIDIAAGTLDDLSVTVPSSRHYMEANPESAQVTAARGLAFWLAERYHRVLAARPGHSRS